MRSTFYWRRRSFMNCVEHSDFCWEPHWRISVGYLGIWQAFHHKLMLMLRLTTSIALIWSGCNRILPSAKCRTLPCLNQLIIYLLGCSGDTWAPASYLIFHLEVFLGLFEALFQLWAHIIKLMTYKIITPITTLLLQSPQVCRIDPVIKWRYLILLILGFLSFLRRIHAFDLSIWVSFAGRRLIRCLHHNKFYMI